MPPVLPSAALAAVVVLGLAAPAPGGPASVEEIAGRLAEIAAHPHCTLRSIGTSREGRDLPMLVLADDADAADRRPGLLVVAGLDGRRLADTGIALEVARSLLDASPALLEAVTIYVVPCANPDAAARSRATPGAPLAGTLDPVDDDRDGRRDEDPPRDIDGDGLVTMMRQLEPPLGEPPTHLPDPAEPRLMKTPDRDRGERATHRLFVEGLDGDGDGLIAEDGAGTTLLDRNFMHAWPEHQPDAGRYPLSEPEALALAQLVIARTNLVAAVVYGRHDTLVHPPDGKGRDVTGRAPRLADPDDVAFFAAIGTLYRETTGRDAAPTVDDDGSLHAWLIGQRGLPAFATTLWQRPTVDEADDADEEGILIDVRAQDADDATGVELAVVLEETKSEDAPKEDLEPADAEAAAWLALAEARGASFVPWRPFDHPTLGAVEIGGFAPLFREDAPEEDHAAIAAREAEFLVALAERRPRLEVIGPEMRRLADGLHEIRIAIRNDGGMPTMTRRARAARAAMPTLLRIDAEPERLLSGERIVRAWGVDAGDRFETRWIIRGADDGVVIEIIDPRLGTTTLRATPEADE